MQESFFFCGKFCIQENFKLNTQKRFFSEMSLPTPHTMKAAVDAASEHSEVQPEGEETAQKKKNATPG